MSIPRVLFLCLWGVAITACGGDEPATDTAPEVVETREVEADVAPDVDPNATVCCPVGTCADSREACINGACVPKKPAASSCYFDGECRDGKQCVGETYCACGTTDCVAVPGTCGFGEGCCDSDADCSGGLGCVAGTCKGKPATGCLRDDHCAAGQVCEGEAPAVCGQAGSDVVGHCAVAGVCCVDDRECGEGVCRGGSCVEEATGDACWADGECTGGQGCLGLHLCQCVPGAGACDLPSAPGRCGVAADSCCSKDVDCGAGEICVAGQCGVKPQKALDDCWLDEHCGVGRVCEGASLCGCDDAECTSTIGQCKTLAIPCGANDACPVNMHCVTPDTAFCPGSDEPMQKMCVADTDGGCWEASDCPTVGQRCGTETICRDPEGCDWPNAAGECAQQNTRWQCCDSHLECGPGYVCRNQDTSVTCPPASSAVCLEEAIYAETCWNVTDCPPGLACARVWVCGCDGKCSFNRQGSCVTPTYCQTNFDCGEGYTCATDPECFSSPCTSATTCESGGRCQEKVDGGCWSHSDCGDGQYCDGLRVCPMDLSCALPDQPGVCGPRAALGECCSSFKGCEPGLRCLSPAERSGCNVDYTSVCVPAVTPGTSCFGDDDCDEDQRCEGARVCPCGVEACTNDPQPGTCIVK